LLPENRQKCGENEFVAAQTNNEMKDKSDSAEPQNIIVDFFKQCSLTDNAL